MEIITLDEFKEQIQLNDDADYDSEDNYLTSLIEVSEEAVLSHLQRTYDELISVYGVMPFAIKHAVKLMAAHLYNSREPVTFGVTGAKVPLSFEYLLIPYLKF